MTGYSEARIVSQPNVRLRFQRGIRQIIDAVRPTLGPLPRTVASARKFGSGAPELLDDGAVIARRIVELPARTENAGAMLARHMLWQLHESVGDGTATAAVIFGALYDEGCRYLASGGNAMALRRALEAHTSQILDSLDAQTQPLEGKAALGQLGESICHDRELAAALAEIFDAVGSDGWIDVRAGRTRGLEIEYADGSSWKSGVLSDKMIGDGLVSRRLLYNAAILISDLDLQDPHDLVPVMQAAIRPEIGGLVIVAKSVSESLVGLLVSNQRRGQFEIIAVRAPGSATVDQYDNLADLATLTGARPILSAAGDTARRIQWEDLGLARRVWADGEHFGIVSGGGAPCARRQRIEQIRARAAVAQDAAERRRLARRLGVLLGGSALLKVGGATKSESEFRLRLARRTVDALRGAIGGGLVPGGGIALLNCRDALRAESPWDADEHAALQMLHCALEAPARVIASNAGYEPSAILAAVLRGETFDVLRGEAIPTPDAGIFDSAGTVRAVVTIAIHTAALALTTDTLVLPKSPSAAAAP